jgi:hypothetical protein
MSISLRYPKVPLSYRATAIVKGMERGEVSQTLGVGPSFVHSGVYSQLCIWREGAFVLRCVFHEGLLTALHSYSIR